MPRLAKFESSSPSSFSAISSAPGLRPARGLLTKVPVIQVLVLCIGLLVYLWVQIPAS